MREDRAGVLKQIIVVRKDLEMDYGKFGAQVSHASISAYKQTEKIIAEEWFSGEQTKVILSIKSEQALLTLYEKVKGEGLPCSLIQDAGYTVFNGVKTNTCLGIGPVLPREVEHLTKRLRLY